MKTLIQIIQSKNTSLTRSAYKVVALLVFVLASMNSYSQVDCNITMACNDGIQVSLDENCEALITPDMMLEDPAYDDSFFKVTVTDQYGNIVPNSLMNYSHVNQSFSVNVQLDGCPSACWGTITIEDKLPPVIQDCGDITVDCDADLTPGVGVPLPSAVDACSAISDMDYTETSVKNPCSNTYIKTVTRVWTVSDAQGNEATCTQTIQVMKASIIDITFPPNYDNIDKPAFSCAVTLETLPNGAPSPEVTGYPDGVNCPNIQMYYSDIIFPLCGASLKVLRQWVVVDWCTGEERTQNQVIKVIDDKAPIVTANEDFINEIYTDPGLCTGTFVVPAPIVIFECSDYNYTVGYKLRDENGNPFENPIYDNVTFNPSTGLYTITGLPQDTSWIVYTVTDACNNSTMAFTEVMVHDNEAPIPVCEGYTVVSLDDIGWADIYATSIDDESYDNCEIDRFEVKRLTTNCGNPSDLQFSEKVNFCCNDVDKGYIKVVMRVYDVSGNYNDCIVNVNVQDKINPTITCPSNVTISCEQDYNNTAITGVATGTDNCSVQITKSDVLALNDCGIGTVTREWVATDPQGRTALCYQTITVRDLTPFTVNNINWPSDREIVDCDLSNATPEALNSFPILSNTECTNIAISYEDNVFYGTPEYCVKVLRHWKIIDWCNYNPQNPTYFQYTQKIGVINTSTPTFESCDNVTIDAEGANCSALVDITVSATDDCTPSALLKYTYAIDVNNNGTIEYNGITQTINRTLPSGTHKITWTATDKCDNTSTCMQLVSIKDNKPPTPICLGNVTWNINSEGNATVWASDFNLKSEDSCDEEENLTFAFDADGIHTSLTFTCADVPNGISEDIALQMYVFDSDGNYEYCDVVLTLFDSELNNACADSEGSGRIAGVIVSTDNEGIDNVEVQLMDMEVQEAEMDMTHEAGQFAFEDVTYYNTYSVEPYKNDDCKNGVSTLDLVLIQRHILELSPLDSPYKLIAADINKNNKITSTDLLALRKLILGVTDNFVGNTSWRFVPNTFEIEDPTYPFDFPEKIVIDGLYSSEDRLDFTAIKVGDVNGSATINLKGDEEASERKSPKTLILLDQEFDSNTKVSVPVFAHDVASVSGFQAAFSYGDNLTFEGISSGRLDIDPSNWNYKDGNLAISWVGKGNTLIEDTDVLFTLEFTSNASGFIAENISLNNQVLNPEIYDEDLSIYELNVEFGVGKIISTTRLYQNTPNPFKQMTTIGFDLVERGTATISIMDISGKQVYKMTDEFGKGYNEVTIDISALGVGSGVLYYQLSTQDFAESKKMILMN